MSRLARDPNLLAELPDASGSEVFTELLSRPGCRIERIVSQGQVTPPDQPYRQAHDEWVLLLAGAARVALAGAETALAPGDTLFIPAGTEHRVTFTDPARPTVWLAVHLGEIDPPAGG
ncbi:cupin [Methylobacterium sp. Leaf104]|uniref:cupin domain-containing protein n=1 Tax=Methylobacterium TaxID=407 RepID=UPI0006F5F1CC|nr:MULTISPECIES: cupin domain-containing protein [Methylobacterium]KQP29890.1 cupin [Methylobacterium sp. Leaf104]MCI9882419.1 cupin domain-containing protein [Methylobacterium goesingense]